MLAVSRLEDQLLVVNRKVCLCVLTFVSELLDICEMRLTLVPKAILCLRCITRVGQEPNPRSPQQRRYKNEFSHRLGNIPAGPLSGNR